MSKKRTFRITPVSAMYIVVFTIFTISLWFFRPLFHGTLMFFYTNPAIVLALLVWYVLHRFVLKAQPVRSLVVSNNDTETEFSEFSAMSTLVKSFVLLMILFSIAVAFSVLAPQMHLVNELEYNSIGRLPATTDNIRLMPYEVASRFSRDSLQLSQYKLGTENIALINGSIAWMFPLVPDGAVIKFALKNHGIVYVDATTQARNSQLVRRDLEIGEGMLVLDNLHWNLYKKKYWTTLDDPYYVPHNGDVYTVVSLTTYTYHQKLGIPYTVPRYGGVILASSSGDIRHLTPEEASAHPVLVGNRLFPESLARQYAEVYAYNKGLINKFFIHEDQIEIRDAPGFSKSNMQPYLMDTDDGLKWFISAEPSGESRGIFKIFLIDAITGNIELFELPIEQTLTGPVRATDFVRRDNPTVDWTRFKIVEPLPFIRGDVLYWKVVVIPVDAAGIAYQAFVDTRTNDVTRIDTDDDVREFIVRGSIAVPAQPAEDDNLVSEIRRKLAELNDLVSRLENR